MADQVILHDKQGKFIDGLRAGDFGLRFPFPDSFQMIDEFPLGANFLDENRNVAWHIGFSPSPLVLDPEHDALLRRDIKMFLRGRFETETPRTLDPEWSPLVDMEYATLPGSTALLIVYRSAYEPGNEALVGELYVPLSTGHVYFDARCRVGTTGFRESYLVAQAIDRGRSPGQAAAIAQSEIDDPRHDARFPRHALSIVRAAMRWLVESADIEVTDPMSISTEEETRLEDAECAVVLPPRYALNPTMSHRMAEGLIIANRVCPPGSSSMSLDIWRLPANVITGWNAKGRLKRLAAQTIRNCKREGASQIRLQTRGLPDYDGRTQIETYVRFHSGADYVHSVMWWFVDTDGQVFRVAAAGPQFVPRSELTAHVEAVVGSWRRLEPS
jgi:hypothetical protein